MADALTRSEVFDRIASSCGVLESLLSKLTPQQWQQPLGDGWSPVVHLAHITAWEESLLALLNRQSRAKAMAVPDELWQAHDTDAINAHIARRASKQSEATVKARFQAVHQALLTRLSQLDDEDLALPYAHYQPDAPDVTAPILGWVLGNTSDHYDAHAGWLRSGLERSRG